MKMLYTKSFNLKLFKKIRNAIYKSLPEHIVSSADFHYENEVEQKAFQIYAKKDREYMLKALCRLNKVFAGKKIVAVDYVPNRYISKDIFYDLKSGNIFDYNYLISEMMRQKDVFTISQIFICKEFAKIEIIADGGKTKEIRSFCIKEISSKQYDDFISQSLTNELNWWNKKCHKYCLEIYNHNKAITLRRAA